MTQNNGWSFNKYAPSVLLGCVLSLLVGIMLALEGEPRTPCIIGGTILIIIGFGLMFGYVPLAYRLDARHQGKQQQ